MFSPALRPASVLEAPSSMRSFSERGRTGLAYRVLFNGRQDGELNGEGRGRRAAGRAGPHLCTHTLTSPSLWNDEEGRRDSRQTRVTFYLASKPALCLKPSYYNSSPLSLLPCGTYRVARDKPPAFARLLSLFYSRSDARQRRKTAGKRHAAKKSRRRVCSASD